MATRYLLFTLALLESTELQKEVYGIDKRTAIASCAFLYNLGCFEIAKKLEKKQNINTIDFSQQKIQILISHFTATMLKQKFFPPYVIEVISKIKPFNPTADSVLYENTDKKTEVISNLLSLLITMFKQ